MLVYGSRPKIEASGRPDGNPQCYVRTYTLDNILHGRNGQCGEYIEGFVCMCACGQVLN